MSVSVTNVQTARTPGDLYYSIKEVTLDASYAEGGESLTARELGLRRVVFAQCEVQHGTESSTIRAVSAYYTPSTAKIHLIDSATGKEVEATKDLSKVVVRVVAFGKP